MNYLKYSNTWEQRIGWWLAVAGAGGGKMGIVTQWVYKASFIQDLLGRKVMTNLDSILKKQRYYFANKGPSSQGYGFSSGHVWM